MAYLNVAGYYFYKTPKNLEQLQARLREECLRLSIRGTILLAKEGINLVLAGAEEAIHTFQDLLRLETKNPDFEFKESWCDEPPFKRLRIKVKPQIIVFKARGINPRRKRAPSIQPETLKEWLDQKRDIILLDTRNRYEVDLGTFENASHLDIRHFSHYETQAKKIPDEIKDKQIVMFCTGGIRCEKAAPLMKKIGFKKILQLEGGILNYFEKTGGDHYKGDCFVFDDRVALTPDLEEAETIDCSHCGQAVNREERRRPQFRFGKCCLKCAPPAPSQSKK